MANLVLTAMPSAAVATSGTLTFTLPAAAQWGQFQYEGAHVMYAEGLNNQFYLSNGDFSISASGATLTVTYNGTTTIPAGSVVKLELRSAGEVTYLGDGKGNSIDMREKVLDYFGNIRANATRIVRVELGRPAAASGTAILATTAVTVTAVNTLATAVVNDVPRGLAYVSSNAGDTTQTITARGFDEFNNAMTETVTLNGTTTVNGKKAFKTVVSYQASASLAGNLSIGTQAGVFGLPFFLQGGTSAGAGYVIKEVMDATVPTAGTFVGGDLTAKATATSGDVRGTYTPNTAPNGTHVYELFISASDLSFKGVPQYAG